MLTIFTFKKIEIEIYITGSKYAFCLIIKLA